MSLALLAGLPLLLLGYAPVVERKSSATEANKAMMSWWCGQESHKDGPGCTHQRLANELSAATTEPERAQLLSKLKELSTQTRMQEVHKEYVEMKASYCNTMKPPNKTLCSAPATTFKRSPGTENGAMAWYCSQSVGRETEMCKRYQISQQINLAGSEQRADLVKEMQKHSRGSYSQIQAVYADYCNVHEHRPLPFCVNIRQTKTMKEVAAQWCSEHADGVWCEHSKLVEILQQENTPEAARFEASNKLKTINGAKMSKEIVLARRAWCDAKPERSNDLFCQERQQA